MSEVKRNLSEIDAQLRVLTRQLKDAARDARLFSQQLQINPLSLNLAAASTENVRRQINLTTKQVETLRERLSQTKDTSSDTFIKMNNQLKLAEANLITLRKELVKVNNAKIDGLTDKLSTANKVAKALLGSLVAIGTALIKMGGDLKALSIKTGVAVEDLQKFDYVFQQISGTSGQFGEVLESTITLLGLVAKGTARAEKNLAAMGLTFDDVRNKTPIEALTIIIDALKQIENEDERLAASMALFGQLGPAVANFAGLSADEIAALVDELEEMGIISDANATAALELKRAWNALMREFKEVIIQLGVDLLPLFKTLIQLAINLVPILSTIGKALEAIGPVGQVVLFIVILLVAFLPQLAAAVKAVNVAMLLLGKNPIALKILLIATAVAALITLLSKLAEALGAVFGKSYSLDIDTKGAESIINGTTLALTGGGGEGDTTTNTTTVYDYSETHINIEGDVDVDELIDEINTRKIIIGG